MDQGQVSDRRHAPAARELPRVAVLIGESIELLDVAEGQSGLRLHPVAQAEIERPVALGIERAERQGVLRLLSQVARRRHVHGQSMVGAPDNEDPRLFLRNRDDYGVQSDDHRRAAFAEDRLALEQ